MQTPPKDTILVVDDDPDWRTFVTDALASCYTVVSSSTGREGVWIAKVSRPAAIVLDVLMAGTDDGFTILAELRKHAATRNIPVVLFSNVNAVTHLAFDTANIQTQLGTSPDAFLEKPASAKTVLRTVTEVIARRRPGHATP